MVKGFQMTLEQDEVFGDALRPSTPPRRGIENDEGPFCGF